MRSHTSRDASKNRPTLGQMIDHSTLVLLIVIGFLIIMLASLNLFHKNASATKGYVLRKLEQERTELIKQEEQMNMRISEAQSLQVMEGDVQIRGMVEVTNLQYIKGDATLAKEDE